MIVRSPATYYRDMPNNRGLARRPRGWLMALLTTSAAFCFSEGASAGSAVALEYSAPAACPDRAQFAVAVAARGGSFERSDAGSPLALRIEVRADGNGFVGTLDVRTQQGESATRRVQADNCAEVVDGLAVVTAIALREDASRPPPPESADSQPPVRAGVAEEQPATPPAATATVPSRLAPPADSRLRTVGQWDARKSVPVSAGDLGINRAFALTLSGGAVFGAVPNLILPRYDLTLTAANFISTPAAQKYLVGGVPQARLSLFGDSTLRSSGFETTLSGIKSGMGLCASIWYDLQGLVLLACAHFSAGLMQIETKDATGAVTQTKNVGLGSAGIDLTARYSFGRYIHGSLSLGGESWISELSAERPDGSRIFDSRPFNGHVQLGLGMNF